MTELRRISLFEGNSPESLQRQVRQLEDNSAEAVRKLDAAFLPVLVPTNTKTGNYIASIGEMVIVDSSAGNIAVTAPVATVKNAGRCFAVVRKSAANAVVVAAVSGLVTGAASDTLPTTLRIYLFFSDGTGWWRTP